ncbi:MAG: DNA replication/repair protein RecF [Alphaproteobacteria bacterium]|nr:MAG: DNA replication/repair protein RecF [Alphaproteobacteria bacterium]
MSAHAPGPSLAIVRLVLTGFRNYASAALDCDTRPVVLTGPNGAGKTNILEAVSLLAPGRGLRRATLAELRRIPPGDAPWAVAARLATPAGVLELGTGLDPDGGERRLVRINGAPASGPAALAEHVAIAWMTPAMDRLFADGASARRRFLDRIVLSLHHGHGREVAAYEAAMRERNALLAQPGRVDGAWAAAVEDRMAAHGVAVAAARREAVGALEAQISDRPASAFPRAAIALEGLLEGWLATASALDAEERFRALLADTRGRDGAAGRTLDGPHRSDLLVRHAEKNMPANQCSTGEQKALLAGLVLAHAGLVDARLGLAPILLLDEVAAHFDSARRAALLDAIAGLSAQAWLTGTDAGLFEALGRRGQFFTVMPGGLVSASANA